MTQSTAICKFGYHCFPFQLFKAQANQTHVKIAGLMSVATAKEFHLNEEILNEISRGKL